MPDPITTLGLGALAAYLGKDGLEKLLGPTADYLGSGLRDLTQKRIDAIGRIFKSAQDKLGGESERLGEVPPKVLNMIMNEASYASTALEVEYFGGILASSRTESGRDDRGARLAKLVDSLSTYQLRTHYLIYTAIRKLFADSGLLFDMDGRPKMSIFIPLDDYVNAMDFDKAELDQFVRITTHSLHGLHAESLIGEYWQMGSPESMKKIFPKAEVPGIACHPSALGAELYLSAFGHSNKPLDFIFQSELIAGSKDLPEPLKKAIATSA